MGFRSELRSFWGAVHMLPYLEMNVLVLPGPATLVCERTGEQGRGRER